MSPPFYSEMLFPYQRSHDVKHNPKTITAVWASDRQIWTFQAARLEIGMCRSTLGFAAILMFAMYAFPPWQNQSLVELALNSQIVRNGLACQGQVCNA